MTLVVDIQLHNDLLQLLMTCQLEWSASAA